VGALIAYGAMFTSRSLRGFLAPFLSILSIVVMIPGSAFAEGRHEIPARVVIAGEHAREVEPEFGLESERRSSRCDVNVRPRANLNRVMASHAAGTTYCLAAGTFEVTSTINTEPRDRVIGSGRNDTVIDGTRLAPTAPGIFITDSGNHFAKLDIFGAPTPAAGSGVFCSPESYCGDAFSLQGSSLTLRSVDCHNNGGTCIGGKGSSNVTVKDLNCWNNGNRYSMTPEFVYAACIKRFGASTSGNDTTVIDSHIHDNAWVGLWCDFCEYGVFRVENSRIIHNGASGILWEMSGGWTSEDRAIVRNNVIRRNTYRETASFHGGVGISTSNDITVKGNTFGHNRVAGVSVIFTADRNPPQPDSRGVVISDNTMNGDDVLGCSLEGVIC
jgi:Right handed beta helix region